MAFVVANPEFPLDDLRDTAARPNLATKPICLGPMPQELRDQVPLCSREFGGMTRTGMSEERSWAERPGTGKPTAHGLRRHVKCLRDNALRPTLPLEL
jgi:hypothetical protein